MKKHKLTPLHINNQQQDYNPTTSENYELSSARSLEGYIGPAVYQPALIPKKPPLSSSIATTQGALFTGRLHMTEDVSRTDSMKSNRIHDEESNGSGRPAGTSDEPRSGSGTSRTVIPPTGSKDGKGGNVKVSPFVDERTFEPDSPDYRQIKPVPRLSVIAKKVPKFSHIQALADRTNYKTKLFLAVLGGVFVGGGIGLLVYYPNANLRDLLILGIGCIVIGATLLLSALVIVAKDICLQLKAEMSEDDWDVAPGEEAQSPDVKYNPASATPYVIPTSENGLAEVSHATRRHSSAPHAVLQHPAKNPDLCLPGGSPVGGGDVIRPGSPAESSSTKETVLDDQHGERNAVLPGTVEKQQRPGSSDEQGSDV